MIDFETRQKLEALQGMFHSEAWDILMKELSMARDSLSNVRAISSSEVLHFNKGKLAVLDELVNYPEAIKMLLDQDREKAFNAD